MFNSKEFYVIADHTKRTNKLGTAYKFVPIEVVPMAAKPLLPYIEKTEGTV